MKKFQQIKVHIAGLLLSCSVVPLVVAEDIEIYSTPDSVTSGVKPNILFIIDGSLDMLATSAVLPAYVSATTYTGDCNTSNVYYSTGSSLPVCNNQNSNYFDLTALACDNAVVTTEFVLDGDGNPTATTVEVDGPLISSGTYSDRIAHYAQSGAGGNATYAWRAVEVTQQGHKSFTVECQTDSGVHGETDASADKYIKDGTDKYTSTDGAHSLWQSSSTLLTLYNANYINYRNDTSLVAGETSYFDQVRGAIENMVDGNSQVNIGMMVLDQKGATDPISEGGGILYEIQDGSSPRGNFIPQMWALNAEGFSPLSEAYYEALLYFGGKSVDYGSAASPPLVGTATGTGNTDYISPIELSCQANYIVVASNGKATDDDISDARQAVLAADGFVAGQCSGDSNITANDTSDDNLNALTSDSSTNDNCLDELAYWAANNDVAKLTTGTYADAHAGEQTIITHTVGFGYDAAAELDAEQAAGKRLLQDTADKSDEGEFYSADSQEAIEAAFKDIIDKALKVESSFSSPAVSVNAFNRSTHLDDLYFTLFKPANSNHWEGNLKKYKIEFEVDSTDRDGDGDTTEKLPFIADLNHSRAVDDSTGFFGGTSQSYWSTTVDGKEVDEGGAVGVFTTARKVYTFTGTYVDTDGVNAPSSSTGDLTLAANLMDPTNTRLHDTTGTDNADDLLATASKDEYIVGTPYNETLTNWAKGLDALSDFGDVDTFTDVRPQMGDPLHAEPALVQYGETGSPAVPDLAAYVATNDGYLHAFDINTGAELFSFVPQELLPNLKTAMEDVGGDKLYGLDGSVVAWINDANGDGTISSADGDHVYLYFSMRRGGNNIYATDVTIRTNPALLWVIKGGTGNYTKLGQTWSTINVEKIKDGADEKTVLIFGGGYDTAQDTADTVRAANTTGNTVYIADATTGARLWSAGSDGANIANLSYSIPARIKPLDLSGDGYIDRLYAADTGGQIFRFDINNTNGASLSSSITGARIVDIAVAASAADNRRFYYPPDVALVDAKDGKYHGLVITSGYRAHPLNETIHDRIYMIKDRNTGLLSSYTDALITEASLYNATANIAGGNAANDADRVTALDAIGSTNKQGWYINLDDEDASTETWIGEKGLSEALIIEGVAVVTTYTPNLRNSSASSCTPSIGLGKVFFLDMLDATPAYPSSLDVRGDRHIELVRGGIPPTPNVIITEGGVPTLCVGTECQQAEFGLGVRKTYWYEVN